MSTGQPQASAYARLPMTPWSLRATVRRPEVLPAGLLTCWGFSLVRIGQTCRSCSTSRRTSRKKLDRPIWLNAFSRSMVRRPRRRGIPATFGKSEQWPCSRRLFRTRVMHMVTVANRALAVRRVTTPSTASGWFLPSFFFNAVLWS